MPRWNRLSEADLQAIAAYVRTIEAAGRPNTSADTNVIEQGRDLYHEIPGTAMPPWETQMTDVQRQAVVAYIESLYQTRVQ
jgi:mono/diheme cytochrome c family protein